jgi:hypothetical protein
MYIEFTYYTKAFTYFILPGLYRFSLPAAASALWVVCVILARPAAGHLVVALVDLK